MSPSIDAGLAGVAPRCRAVLRTITDVDELAQLYPDWDAEYLQLGRGGFDSRVGIVFLPDVDVRWGHLNREVIGRGSPRLPGYIFAPIDAQNCGWRRRGRQLRPGTIEVMAPGDPLDDAAIAGTTGFGVGFAPRALEDAVRVLLRREPADVIPRAVGIQVAPGPFAALHDDLVGVIRRVEADPDAAGGLAPHEVVRMRARLLGRVVRLFEAASPDDPRDAHASRREVVRDAEAYMESHLDEPVTTIDLCRHLDVSRRTLFYAFDEILNSSPMAYFKARRLNLVRADLKRADPRSTRVRDVARRWGFTHDGQFGGDYARLFGERPSATLGRR
jgi:AraC family ethanolamine operon transcriptional activator